MSHENPLGDIRYSYLYIGTVVNREDPLGLHRVSVVVPGLLDEPSGWCMPLGMPGGGAPQRGFSFAPQVGAEVGILFKGGDPDVPYYMTAQWAVVNGASEMPSDVAAAVSDHPEQVVALETDNWKILLDDRVGKETMRLSHKRSGDMIEFDGTFASGPGITIQASAGLYLKAAGTVVIDATSVTIMGRVVTDGSGNI